MADRTPIARRVSRPGVALGLAAMTTMMLGVTACSGNAGTTSVSGTTSASSAVPSAPASSSTGGSGSSPSSAGSSSGTSSRPKTPECVSSELHVALGSGNAGMGHVQLPINFTNNGSSSCALGGFPGVSFDLGPGNHDTTGASGQEVGAPADRSGSAGPAVILAPGQTASADLQMPNDASATEQGNSACQLTDVSGLRVFPPDNTVSFYVPLPSGDQQECGNPAVHTLSIQSVKSGSN